MLSYRSEIISSFEGAEDSLINNKNRTAELKRENNKMHHTKRSMRIVTQCDNYHYHIAEVKCKKIVNQIKINYHGLKMMKNLFSLIIIAIALVLTSYKFLI